MPPRVTPGMVAGEHFAGRRFVAQADVERQVAQVIVSCSQAAL